MIIYEERKSVLCHQRLFVFCVLDVDFWLGGQVFRGRSFRILSGIVLETTVAVHEGLLLRCVAF